jgi:hypothetical protein
MKRLLSLVLTLALGCSASDSPDDIADTAANVAAPDTGEHDEDGTVGPTPPPKPPALEFAPGPPTWEGHALPIYQRYCSPCHNGTSETVCAGKTCFVDFPAELQLQAEDPNCDKTRAECGYDRIVDTREKGFGLLDIYNVLIDVPVSETDILRAWLDLGLPGI